MNKDLEKLSALYDGELPSKEMQDGLAEMHADENLKEIFQNLDKFQSWFKGIRTKKPQKSHY